MKNSQKGFVRLLFIMLVIVILLGGAYVYLDGKGYFSQNELKTFKSSGDQFSSYEFQYPKDWKVYQESPVLLYLTKGKDTFSGDIYQYISNPKNVLFSIGMSGVLANSEDLIKSVYKPIEIGTSEIGGNRIIWFTKRDTNEVSSKTNLLSKIYVLNTPYVGKRTISFNLVPYSAENSQENVKVLEGIVTSFKVKETEAGTIERQAREAKTTTVQGVKNDPDDVNLRAKDAMIRSAISSLRDIITAYWENNKKSYTGLCSNQEAQKLINVAREPGPTRCLAKTQSVMITVKLNLGDYYCISVKTNEYGIPLDERGDVTNKDYQSIFAKTTLSCK